MFAISIGGEAGVDVESGNAAGDDEQNARSGDSTHNLCDHIGQQFGSREALADDELKRELEALATEMMVDIDLEANASGTAPIAG